MFLIGSLDERMVALLGLDASLRPIRHPQKLVGMENAPILSLRILAVKPFALNTFQAVVFKNFGVRYTFLMTILIGTAQQVDVIRNV